MTTAMSWIPPEEGRSGLLLGLSAGVLEEGLFRLAIVPLFLLEVDRHLRRYASIVVTAALSGLLFALAHEVTASLDVFSVSHFVTRFLFPGFFMSLLFFRPAPRSPCRFTAGFTSSSLSCCIETPAYRA